MLNVRILAWRCQHWCFHVSRWKAHANSVERKANLTRRWEETTSVERPLESMRQPRLTLISSQTIFCGIKSAGTVNSSDSICYLSVEVRRHLKDRVGGFLLASITINIFSWAHSLNVIFALFFWVVYFILKSSISFPDSPHLKLIEHFNCISLQRLVVMKISLVSFKATHFLRSSL